MLSTHCDTVGAAAAAAAASAAGLGRPRECASTASCPARSAAAYALPPLAKSAVNHCVVAVCSVMGAAPGVPAEGATRYLAQPLQLGRDWPLQ